MNKEDIDIGQLVGVIWRYRNEDKEWFTFNTAKVSTITTTIKGTKIKTKPQLFRNAMELDEFEDYTKLDENGLIMIDTPLFLSEETIGHYKKVVEYWNTNGAKSILEELL